MTSGAGCWNAISESELGCQKVALYEVQGESKHIAIQMPRGAGAAQLSRVSRDRLMLNVRLAAVALNDPEFHLNGRAQSLRGSGLPQGQQTAILNRARRATIQSTLEDGLLTLYREKTLYRYINHFGLTTK